MTYSSNLKLIKDGEAVAAEVANRPILGLLGNTEYLRDWLRAMSAGSALFAKEQAISPAVAIGQPVYYNNAAGRFEKAFFQASSGDINSTVLADSAQALGVLYSKTTAEVGTILLYGYGELDISAAVDTLVAGDVPTGTWYLSPLGAGILTRTRPMLAVPVLRTFGSNQVLVAPSFHDFDGKHRHHAVDLVMLPAGNVSPPAVGVAHEITDADNGLPGWLPADHSSFSGNAPVGAKFGYNLSEDSELLKVFPPVPLNSAAFIMQRPSVYDVIGERTSHGQQLFADTVILDSNGIWWMTDCYDQVPWPTDYDTTSSESSSSSDSIDECDPQLKLYSLKLYMTRLLFSTNNAYVQSLTSLDSRLVITCSGSDTTASEGPLDIDLDLNFMIGSNTEEGHLVIKEFDPETSTFNRGPVIEAIRATSGNVVLTGGETVTLDNVNYRVGRVGIGMVSESNLELPSHLVRLDGVTEESFPVLYLGMPNDNPTSYIVKFEVPTFVPANMQFRFRPRILGRAAGTLPPLITHYYKTSRPPNGLATPVTVTQSFTLLAMVTVATVAANQAVEALSSGVTVQPGDVVYVRLGRDPGIIADAYIGEVGIMQQSGVLAAS